MNKPLAESRPAEILLVEDNENDVELTRMAFRRSKLLVHLQHVNDGEECMAYLRKENKYANVPTPDIILLDLNMPRMSGREVLAAISEDDSLRHLPVVILTTSAEESEILQMYELRCSSYIIKPVSLDQFVRVVQSLTDYWLSVVVLPPKLPASHTASSFSN